MQVDFSSFQCVIFRCKWWDTFNQNNVKVYHDSVLICTNSKKMLVEMKKPYVFPKHCNQVFFYLDVLDQHWQFVLRHDLRFKHIFESNNDVMPSEEDNQGDSNEEWYVNILFRHIYCWCAILLWVSIIDQLYIFFHFVMLNMNSWQPTFTTIILIIY